MEPIFSQQFGSQKYPIRNRVEEVVYKSIQFPLPASISAIIPEMSFARSVLVTGANRGLGLGLVKVLADKSQHLFAACRRPIQADVSNRTNHRISEFFPKKKIIIALAAY